MIDRLSGTSSGRKRRSAATGESDELARFFSTAKHRISFVEKEREREKKRRIIVGPSTTTTKTARLEKSQAKSVQRHLAADLGIGAGRSVGRATGTLDEALHS